MTRRLRLAFLLVCLLLGTFSLYVVPQVPTTVANQAARATVFVYTNDGEGSGFLISPDGYILTCHHVIEGADSIEVFIPDKGEFSARIVKIAPELDSAVLKVDTKVESYLKLGNSKEITYGDPIAAIGFPGKVFTVTKGTVSAFPKFGELRVLQVTAPVNPGNSGGPLVLHNGKVIGIIFSRADAAEWLRKYGTIPQAMNFAIPINLVKQRFQLDTPMDEWEFYLESRLVYEENFNEEPTNWDTWISPKDIAQIVEGQYHMWASHIGVVFLYSCLPGERFEDFILEVDIKSWTQPNDNVAGIFFRERDTDNYYELSITGNGMYKIIQVIDGQRTDLQEKTFSEYLNTGPEASNHLRVVVQGKQSKYYLNGHIVRELILPDNGLPSGTICLMVSQDVKAAVHASFDNLKIYSLNH